jgi:hypothetical protein
MVPPPVAVPVTVSKKTQGATGGRSTTVSGTKHSDDGSTSTDGGDRSDGAVGSSGDPSDSHDGTSRGDDGSGSGTSSIDASDGEHVGQDEPTDDGHDGDHQATDSGGTPSD